MPSRTECVDVLIIGAGVLGCGTARALLSENRSLRVKVLEKETREAVHQSGRNSGVVHAGYNQKPGTRKARFVVEGNRRLKKFCAEKGVPCTPHGILIVAHTDEELEVLQKLSARAEANGAEVRLLSRREVVEQEPYAVAKGGLLAPEAASFDAAGYTSALRREAENMGAAFTFGNAADRIDEEECAAVVHHGETRTRARLLINCAGLHADRIARMAGASVQARIVPFRGFYSQLRPQAAAKVRGHIYPTPNLQFPFLGVHLSRTWDNRVLVGPGAALALGREAYSFFSGNAADFAEMIRFAGFRKLWRRSEFLRLVSSEWRKSISRRAVAQEAGRMVPSLRESDLVPGPAGIRAQVVDCDGQLVDDLMTAETPHGLHVLNAVSPALTCSLPFCDELAARALMRLDGENSGER